MFYSDIWNEWDLLILIHQLLYKIIFLEMCSGWKIKIIGAFFSLGKWTIFLKKMYFFISIIYIIMSHDLQNISYACITKVFNMVQMQCSAPIHL